MYKFDGNDVLNNIIYGICLDKIEKNVWKNLSKIFILWLVML